MRSDLALFDTVSEWRTQAACRTVNPEVFFPNLQGLPAYDGRPPKAAQPALTICRSCPVMLTCLNWALDHNVRDGVWGGTTEQQRSRMRRRGLRSAS